MYADLSRTYFYAKAVRPVYVKLPDEDRRRRCSEMWQAPNEHLLDKGRRPQLVPRMHPDAGEQQIRTRQRESMLLPAPDHQGGGDGARR